MISPLEEYIKLKTDKNAQEVPGLDLVKYQRVFRPRTSVYGRKLWPGQKVWKLSYFTLCYADMSLQKKPTLSGMYTHRFDAYLTDSEYIMAKITGDQVAVEYRATWSHLGPGAKSC